MMTYNSLYQKSAKSVVQLLILMASLSLSASFEYISLKQLCHYDDPNVPTPIQKKTYAILAPLFSQKPLNTFTSPAALVEKVESHFVFNSFGTNTQALKYVLMLAFHHNLAQETFNLILSKISPDLSESALSMIRQYDAYRLQEECIPFLYQNKVWLLRDGCAALFSDVAMTQECIKSSAYQVFNEKTESFAVLKIPPSSQAGDLTDLVLCLFETGCMSLVDLKQKREKWFREYTVTNHEMSLNTKIVNFDDDWGMPIIGYKDIVCFSYLDSLKFCIFDPVIYSIKCQYTVSKNVMSRYHIDPHETIVDDIVEDPTKVLVWAKVFNSNHFFYAFYKRRPEFDKNWNAYYEKKGDNHDSVNLSYIPYTAVGTSQEAVLYTLGSADGCFVDLSCNDTRLIARDNKETLYVWDIATKPFTLMSKISNPFPLSKKFWLDSDSDKILTEKGIFKIQDVFAGLPKAINFSLPQEKNFIENSNTDARIRDGLSFAAVKIGFFKSLFMRMYCFARQKYWAIKKWTYVLVRFVLAE